MPRKFSMTADFSAKNYRWKKLYKGVIYRVSCQELGLPECDWTPIKSYQAANEWWAKKLLELAQPDLERQREMVSLVKQQALITAQLVVNETQKQLLQTEKNESVKGSVLTQLDQFKGQLEQSGSMPKSSTLGHHIEEFLSLIQPTIKPRTWLEVRDILRMVGGIFGEDFPAKNVNEKFVKDYYLWLIGSRFQPVTRKKHFGNFRRFVRWLDQFNLIDRLPKNLNSKEFKFGVSPKKVKEYPLDRVREILKVLTPRLKLYAQLGLNCAFRNVDISSITKDQFKNGRIIHKRVKTASHENVPTVNFKLWESTIALINDCKAEKGELLFVSSTGTPLVTNRIENGEVPSKDLIDLQWRRAKIEIPLKAFRSIGASLIASNKLYLPYVSHYLGHSPKSLSDKHYVAPSQELFDEIIDWLGEQLGL